MTGFCEDGEMKLSETKTHTPLSYGNADREARDLYSAVERWDASRSNSRPFLPKQQKDSAISNWFWQPKIKFPPATLVASVLVPSMNSEIPKSMLGGWWLKGKEHVQEPRVQSLALLGPGNWELWETKYKRKHCSRWKQPEEAWNWKNSNAKK